VRREGVCDARTEGYCKFGKEKIVRDKEIEKEAEEESDRLMKEVLDDSGIDISGSFYLKELEELEDGGLGIELSAVGLVGVES
jgi:hypothetical protein